MKKKTKQAKPAKADLTDTSPVDAVFVIGTGSKHGNEELRYALRNLTRNCQFVRTVYLVGECPEWVDKTKLVHIDTPDRFSHAKDANIIDKLKQACMRPEIAENILFCSDDQFQTRVCSYEDFAPRWLRRYTPDDSWYDDRKRIWHTRLKNTLAREYERRKEAGLPTDTIYYYQPHMWMAMNSRKFVDYAEWSDYANREDTIIASGYYNFVQAGGNKNFDHMFISGTQKWPFKSTHVAYSDPSFEAAMDYLKRELMEPSEYELLTSDSASDINTIITLKAKIKEEPVWSPLQKDVDQAEDLRVRDIVGWRKVWNDVIRRWSAATDKGAKKVAVPEEFGPEARTIIENNIVRPKEPAKPTAVRTSSTETPKTEGKTCTKCEERRKKAMDARLAHLKELRSKIEAKKSGSPVIVPNDGCMDCAIEHLSTAIAYMNSNYGRPDVFETELAKGEIRVAMQHLLATGHEDMYNRCVQMMDSVYSSNSLFSVSTLRDILRRVIEGKQE